MPVLVNTKYQETEPGKPPKKSMLSQVITRCKSFRSNKNSEGNSSDIRSAQCGSTIGNSTKPLTGMTHLFSNKSKICPFSEKIPHKTLLLDKGCLNKVQTISFFEISFS